MQTTKNVINPLRWLAVIAISSSVLFSCENKEEKKMDVSTEITEPVPATDMDSLPALDTSNNSSTRPETIKNSPPSNQ